MSSKRGITPDPLVIERSLSMADETILRLVEQRGSNGLQYWRHNHPGIQPDLSSADLTNERFWGLDFTNANLRQSRLNNAELPGADFTGADLTGAVLSGTNLTGATLCGADLTNADFQSTTLAGADFRGTTCDNTNFSRTNFKEVKFEGAIFRRATFEQASLPHTLLQNCDCQFAKFLNADLSGIDLSNKNMTGCNFTQTKLSLAQFNKATLSKVIFDHCDMSGADLTGSNCKEAHFDHATLDRAVFKNADLAQARFNSASLEMADISQADFYEARLDQARMAQIKGAPAARNLASTRIGSPVLYFESAKLNLWDRWLDWERVRTFGRLPLFAASYSALVAIPLFFYILEIYNDKIRVFRAWAQAELEDGNIPARFLARTIVNDLHPLAIPDLSVLLLISTVFLAIGSTIYAVWCPSRIKEFSREQWVYQLEHSIVHYLADAWTKRLRRVAAMGFYILGGGGAILVILTKVINAARFVIGA